MKKSRKRRANQNNQTQHCGGSSNLVNVEHHRKTLKEKLLYDRVETGVKQEEPIRDTVADAVIEEVYRRKNAICEQKITDMHQGWGMPEESSGEESSDDDVPGQTCKSKEKIHQDK